MRFRSSGSGPQYLSQRYQRRVLSLLGALVFVVVGIFVAGNPKTWERIFPAEPAETAKPPEPPAKPPAVKFEPPAPLRDDAFIAPPIVAVEPPPGADSPDASPEIGAFVLRPIEDDALGVRATEADAYYTILSRARELPAATLTKHARQGITFAQVMADPDDYRGQLVTIEGFVKRLQPMHASENRYGLRQLYDVWLFTPDSGNHPWRIVCSEIPAGIPEGANLKQNVEVRVTGYFFKRQGYAAQHGFDVAPLVLAKGLTWIPTRPTVPVDEKGLAPYVIGFATVVGGALAFVLWQFMREDRRFAKSQILERATVGSTEHLEALKDVPVTDLNAMFRELSAAATAAETEPPPSPPAADPSRPSPSPTAPPDDAKPSPWEST